MDADKDKPPMERMDTTPWQQTTDQNAKVNDPQITQGGRAATKTKENLTQRRKGAKVKQRIRISANERRKNKPSTEGHKDHKGGIENLFVTFVLFCELPVLPVLPLRLCVFA